MKNKFVLFILLFSCLTTFAQVKPNHIFADSMVLQREKPVKIWGWSSPEETVQVVFGNQVKKTTANGKGEWALYLDPLKANSLPQDLIIKGKNKIIYRNILVGDVWVLGGQSNMEFDLDRVNNGDLEVASANFNNIRLMTIPRASGQKIKKDFDRINEYDSWLDRHDKKGYWFVCSPETVKTFSAMGYIFGRRIYMASQIPIGLIDVSVGGTTLEAWLSSGMLQTLPENKKLIAEWDKKVNAYNPTDNLNMKIANWEKRSEIRKQQGLEPTPNPTEPDPDPALDRNYPGSSYNGMVAAIAGLSIKGILFNQGYNNALTGDARPQLYAKNFINLIIDWRKTFNDENLPFGIIELSAGGTPQTFDNYELEMTDAAPFIREGQLKAYKHLKNTGFVAIYDQQENWYHPRKKIEAGERMARWALHTQYHFDMGWEPAECINVERKSDRILLTFSKEIKTSDDRPFEGFSIAGEDGHFFPAEAKYIVKETDKTGNDIQEKTKLVVWNNLVPEPKEVRYAWARNPIGNVVNDAHNERVIVLPEFRTDSWNYPEAPFEKDELDLYRKKITELRNQSIEWTKQRKNLEIKYLNKGYNNEQL
jgi:sialate O-acetylesterase